MTQNEDRSSLQKMSHLMDAETEGVNSSELTLLLKAFLFLQCHVVFLANKKDRKPMKSQKAGLIKSGCWADSSHSSGKISACFIYENIIMWEVSHTQRVDEKSF